jgi:leader peptidase (prepilin peptidase)/N-methyltransferase
MEIVLGILLFCFGYFISIIAYLDGFEIDGKLIPNIKLNIIPKKKRFIIYNLIAGLTSVLVGLFLYSSNDFDTIFKIILFVVSSIFLHAALVDLICYQIPLYPSLISLGILIIYNILGLVMNFVNGIDCTTIVYTNNLIAGFAGALLFWLIIKISKGKGMGEGDMIMLAIIGLSLGLLRLIFAFYVMIILGSIYGISVAILKKRFKGVKLAFVPFMFIGFLLAMIIGVQVINWYLTVVYY